MTEKMSGIKFEIKKKPDENLILTFRSNAIEVKYNNHSIYDDAVLRKNCTL